VVVVGQSFEFTCMIVDKQLDAKFVGDFSVRVQSRRAPLGCVERYRWLIGPEGAQFRERVVRFISARIEVRTGLQRRSRARGNRTRGPGRSDSGVANTHDLLCS